MTLPLRSRNVAWPRALSALLVLVSCAVGPWARGAGPASRDGRSVVILVNGASADSKAIGAYYAAKRGIPPANICRVTCTTSEVISRRRFNARIREPLRTFLRARGLAAKAEPEGRLRLNVKYLVSTYGVPVKIREHYSAESLERLPRRFVDRNGAAVDSELSLIGQPEYALAGAIPNPMRATDCAAAEPPLFATRLDGPTPEIAKGLVDAALRAERDGLFGLAYVDTRGLQEGEDKDGDDWMRAAATELGRAGFFTRVDRAAGTFHPDMPMPYAAFYFGWYRPHLCGPMARRGFRFAPGAVAYHLHSGSAARLRKTRLGWAGPLVTQGAAASMGAVFEPLLLGTPDVGEFVRLFLSGKTFGESAYAATPYLSWMMTYVGDPLYAPFRGRDGDPGTWADKLPAFWRDLRGAVRAAATDPGRALEMCSAHPDSPLFLELAARVRFRRGKSEEAMALYRRLAEMATDDYSAVKKYEIIADWLAGGIARGASPAERARRAERALAAYFRCVGARPESPHALPVYEKALRLARALRAAESEVALWEGLAKNFPRRAIGRFAAGELWVRGSRQECGLPMVEVRGTGIRPAVDGKGEDTVWGEAAGIEGLTHRRGPPHRSWDARIRLRYSETALFVLARFAAPSHLGAPRGPRVGDETFVLTLLPAPWRDAQHAIRITVEKSENKREQIRLARGVATAHVRTERVKHGERQQEVAWAVEAEIPFAALGQARPARNSVWAANFLYTCSVPKFPFRMVPACRSWAQMDLDPLAGACAGYLVFK